MLRQPVGAARAGCNPCATGACDPHSERSCAAVAAASTDGDGYKRGRRAGRNPRARSANISTGTGIQRQRCILCRARG